MPKAPAPTKIKQLRGNPGRRPLPKSEPSPATDKPTPPRWLSKYARSEWRYIVPKLYELGLLTKIDRAELAAYCEAFASFREATEALQREGNKPVIKTHNGNWVQNPWISIRNKSAESMHKYAQQFGMTPSARTRISVEKPDKEVTLEEELFGLISK